MPYAPSIAVNFRVQLAVTPSTGLSSLTFVSAGSVKQLDSFIKNEFFHNPNIQKEKNVVLLGDFNAKGDHPQIISFDFLWQWHAPEPNSDKGNKSVVCFAEYDKKEHALRQLATMVVYVDGPPPYMNEAGAAVSVPISVGQQTAAQTGGAARNGSHAVSTEPVDPHGFRFSPEVSSSPVFARMDPTGGRDNTQAGGGLMSGLLSPTTETSPAAMLAVSGAPPDVEPEKIDQVLQTEKKTMVIPRPDGDSAAQPEDGPVFRATISSLEKKTGYLKARVKKLLKRSILIYERQMALVEAQMLFAQALGDLANTDIPAFEPLIYHYFDKTQLGGQGGVIEFNRQCAFDMNLHVIEPLRRLYEQEIKLFDFRKRQFDDESSQYYSWLSRYLSMKQEAKGKKKLDGDSKYVEKRKAFELTRFDYYSYIQDLHGGRKQQDVTHQLALYAESEVNRLITISDKVRTSIKPRLDSIVEEFKDANKDWSRQRTAREDKRRALERSIVAQGGDVSAAVQAAAASSSGFPNAGGDQVASDSSSAQPIPALRVNTQGLGVSSGGARSAIRAIPSSVGSSTVTAVPSNDGSYYSNEALRDELDEHDELEDSTLSISAPAGGTASFSGAAIENDRPSDRKEGLLWAMSRPGGINDPIANLNKPGWHKFWVVLDGGRLCEYTNWKQGLDLHNDPINLNVALVREARNAERRFCFEVVTPSYKRVYQATSDEDMMSWIRAINNGISSSLENSAAIVRQPSKPSKIHRVFSRHDDGDIKVGKLRNNDGPSTPSDDHHKGGGGSGSGSGGGGIDKIGRKISLSKNKMLPGMGGSPSSAAGSSRASMQSADKIPERASSAQASTSSLLPVIQQLHASNQQCADCGTASKVEWISINLLAILCIECSGVHRSLGSHISKVRSLTLDTVSFNAELMELIQSVNNAAVNSIWEAQLERRPAVTDASRRQFITEKYVEKKHVAELARPNAYLRRAVAEQSVIDVLRALASRANPNSSIDPADAGDLAKLESESVLIYALRTAPPSARVFPIAELLLLNSATLPQQIPAGLPPAAANYLRAKLAREAGSGSPSDAAAQPYGAGLPTSASHSHSSSPLEKERPDPRRSLNNVSGKIHKRLSGL